MWRLTRWSAGDPCARLRWRARSLLTLLSIDSVQAVIPVHVVDDDDKRLVGKRVACVPTPVPPRWTASLACWPGRQP